MEAAGVVAIGFLLGSLPFSVWVAKAFGGVDLLRVGSRNPGATNVLRAVGKGPALTALALDISKGALPLLLARSVDSGEVVMALAAVAAILGHVTSPFLGMRGGKGVATSFGALLVLSPVAAIAGLVVFLVAIGWKRYVSLASILAAATIALLALADVVYRGAGRPGQLATVVVAGVVILRHVANARRLLEGTEPRLGERVNLT